MSGDEPGADTGAAASAFCLAWLRSRGHAVEGLEPMPGDVSARRYFRLRAGGLARIVAFYPPALLPACRRWIVTDGLLRDAGIRTPEILDRDCETGFMLLEDLGSETLQDRASSGWPALRPWLVAALDVADRVRRLDGQRVGALQPPLGAPQLAAELDQTWNLYLEPHGLCGDAPLAAALRRGLDRLVSELAATAPEPCHRDFMARNIVPLAGGAVAVLDHQDLRLGPPLYDHASLTNDTLYLPAAWTEELLGSRLDPPRRSPGLPPRCGPADAQDRRHLRSLPAPRRCAPRGAHPAVARGGPAAPGGAAGDRGHRHQVAPRLVRSPSARLSVSRGHPPCPISDSRSS